MKETGLAAEAFTLVWPDRARLPSYMRALEQGWSPDNLRPEAGAEALARATDDADAFLAEQVDRDGALSPVILPDGRSVPRLPGFHKWMWDGEFCGDINLRWQPGTTDLPPYCLGHIGFSVVPRKRRRGYATKALALILPDARGTNLPFVELTCDATNIASRAVIEANGGVLVERFNKPASYGGAASFRFRIDLV
jgi:predicted acetyltransferase